MGVLERIFSLKKIACRPKNPDAKDPIKVVAIKNKKTPSPGIYISYNSEYLDYDFSNSNQEEWLNFDNMELQNLISQGNTVFVDITADWCITCKANKILVLNSKEFKRLIRDNKITLMKGDWTKPNDDINKFLQNANRYGIPFNALYNSNFPSGLLYSEILSLEDIKESLIKLHSSNAK